METLYKDWEFISNIPKNAKPCFNDKTMVNMNEWFVTLKRRYKGEIAEKGISYIQNLIEESIIYKNDKKMQEIFTQAIHGLKNLVYTYKMDGQEEVSKQYSSCINKIESTLLKKNFFHNSLKIISKNNKY